ncbi:Serine carboxypeptidase-like 51 [Striga hermonthica]|uniref:Carboxypeptidase n=1 Tax=Striga hermonthica TaxID=68872 RepID=A0A9N7R6T4_STRHE|nr:Serine carboxypeptidase-like 51 [Striga hermonthica]
MGNEDGTERWGYVEVRDQVNLFWWYYRSPNKTEDSTKQWPVILWLQGGPGASGVGKGNFEEIGPLNVNLEPRSTTWLNKADLLFVDSPAGTGFSYVNDSRLLVTSDEEAAIDLTKLLIHVFNACESLPMSPLYIVGESYGGKHAAILALNLLYEIQSGNLKATFGGLILGSSWISPADFTSSWGPVLKYVSRLDENGLRRTNSVAKQITQQVEAGDFLNATTTFNHLVDVLVNNSWGVDIYNFMLDELNDPLVNTNSMTNRYTTFSTSSSSSNVSSSNLTILMNGVIREKLKIIPPYVKWEFSSDLVFNALAGEFMKPRINEVDLLLEKGVPVTIYTGQLDVICSPKGTETWVKKLKWEGLQNFLSTERVPIFYTLNDQGILFGFNKSYKSLTFYWILGAGHFVPAERPFVAMEMIGKATNSPALSF